MPPIDLDRIERSAIVHQQMSYPTFHVRPADGLDLVAAVRWALDAAHHPGCSGWDVGRCKCGRDAALAPFGATT